MTIELLTPERYNTLKGYYTNHPKLTFENKGYEYIDKSALSESDLKAIKEIEEILKDQIEGFVEFFNFRDRGGKIQIRFDYHYDISFVGVGYIFLDELLNGFN